MKKQAAGSEKAFFSKSGTSCNIQASGSNCPKHPERPGGPVGASVPSVEVRGHNARKAGRPPWSAEIHLRFKSHVSFTVGLSLHQEQASCPEGNNF